ncbi:ABC transporter permease [candidate division KSB1 bacterium]
MDHIIYMGLYGNLKDRYKLIKNEFLKNPNIKYVTLCSRLPNTGSFNLKIDWEGRIQDKNRSIDGISVDFDYFEMLDIKFIEGRSFLEEISSDVRGISYIINESAVQFFGLENPIGKGFTMWGEKGKIVGIVKDFNYRSLKYNIEPLFFTIKRRLFNYIMIKIKPQNVSGILGEIKRVCNEFNPDYPFEYYFLDEKIDSQYKNDLLLWQIFKYYAVISILIACLGLFGLAAFAAEQRTKEIGIRKVLGAGISEIVSLLNKGFILIVVLANIIAWPFSYYLMNNWLQNFAYKINIQLWMFVLSGLIALIIALLTVFYLSVKAARTDPVKSLKYE